MALMNRNTLKNFFKRGQIPTEVNFADLIDSVVNKIDDGFTKTPKDGMVLAPEGTSHKLLSFYENMRDKNPAWSVSLESEQADKGFSVVEGKEATRLFIAEGGNVGIGTTQPSHQLSVNGAIGMRSRVGTYAAGTVPGDGKWHTILQDLKGSNAFEIMAYAGGAKGRGKYAMLHATALNNYGGRHSPINKTQSYFRFFWHKIDVRWIRKKGSFEYSLQLKTKSHYGINEAGIPYSIEYQITQLWNRGH
ncbi:MAG: hypothetical protein ACPGXL_09310 [Chitinophagales bacterium]